MFDWITVDSFTYSFFAIFSYYFCFLYFELFNSLKKILILLLSFLVILIVHFNFDSIADLLCFGFFLIYEISQKKPPLNGLFITVVSLLIPRFCKNIISYIIWNTSINTLSAPIAYLIPYILFILLAIPILLVVRKLYVEIKLKNNYFLSLTIVLFIVYFILLMNQLFVYISYYNDFSGYAIFATVLVAIFVLSLQFFFYNEIVKKRIENIKKEEMIHAAEQFNLEVEKQNNEIKKFKHDYRNILLSLDYFIEQKEWGKLRKYYEITIKESQKNLQKTNFTLSSINNLVNFELKSILQTKLLNVQENGIELNVTVIGEIEVENQYSLALVRGLGIILDNALEELETLNGGKLNILFTKEEEEVVIIISNSCSGTVENIRTLKTKGFSSKGMNRGLGLSNLQEIINENDFVLETSVKNNLFTQIIRIQERMK